MSDDQEVTAASSSPRQRWMVLFFISLAMFGNYYVYDSIAPVAQFLKDDLRFTDTNIGSLNSVYSIAAIIVLLVGGVVIDRFGTAISTLVFGGLCTVAAVINALSSDLTVMLIARFVLGLGAEPLIVAITTALARWFKGRELGFAFGLNLMIARFGSVAADLSPGWAKFAYTGWQNPLILSAAISVLCIVGAAFYWVLETRAMREKALVEAGATDKLVWSDLFLFNRSFWFVVALCATFYSAVFPFHSTFAIKFFVEAFNTTLQEAGEYNSILPLTAMFTTPLFGLLVDRLGHRALFMIAGAFFMMPVYVIMAYKLLPLDVPIMMLGIAFSLIPAVMWPAVAYLIEQRRLGTAYAVMTFLQQIGMAIMNWLIGRTNDAFVASAAHPMGYVPGMWIFTTLGVLALLFAFLLRRAEQGPQAHGLETITIRHKEGMPSTTD